MIHFVCWKWRSKTYRTVFEAKHVNVLAGMLRRHYKAEHRLICITDDPTGVKCETHPLWKDLSELVNPSGAVLPSCYRRLKLFAGETTQAMGIEDGERVASLDLDVVLTGEVTALFDREEDFVGWKGIGTYRPVVYNGSLWMFRAGRLRWLWDEFDPDQTPKLTREAKYFGSDQGWMSYRLNGSAPGLDIEDGVYSFARDIHRQRKLPANARIVFFNGKRKPWERLTQREQPWIAKHWRA
jgi:hypothetical protein